MAITVHCPCGKKLTADDRHAGKKSRCPGCGKVLTIAAPPSARRDVFISHSAKDAAVAQAVCAALEKDGVRCWIAPRDILGGRPWSEAIIDAIDECPVMVLIFSKQSNDSTQVQREIDRASHRKRVIIPFRIHDVPMSKSLEFYLSASHWLDAINRPLDPHLLTLTRTVKSQLGGEKAPPAAPPPPSAPPKRSALPLLLGLGGALAALLLIAAVAALVFLPKGIAPTVASGEPTAPAPAPPAATESTPASLAEISLRGGKVLFRSEGASLRAAGASAGDVVRVTNRPDAAALDPVPSGSGLVLFQINNQSEETVTLSQLEVILLGVVTAWEDRIPVPTAPLVVKPPADLVVERDDPRERADYVDLAAVFRDPNAPPSELRFEAGSSDPELVAAAVDERKRLNLRFDPVRGGKVQVVVVARNAFDLFVTASFNVEVKGRIDSVVNLPRAVAPIWNTTRPVGPGVPAFTVELTRQSLGAVAFDHVLAANAVVRPCSSGNLLPEDSTSSLRVNSARSFAIRLGSQVSVEWPPRLPRDLLTGTGGRRLESRPPELTTLWHLVTLRLRVTSEDGARHDVYGDKLYLLTSQGGSPLERSDDTPPRLDVSLTGLQEVSPHELLATFLTQALPLHFETVAYNRAVVCGAVPAGFSATDVSPFCFYGHASSPFRPAGSGPLGVAVLDRDGWPRSNLIPTLAGWRTEHPQPWRPVESELELTRGDDAPARRAAYLVRQLSHAGTPTHTVSSRVLVEER